MKNFIVRSAVGTLLFFLAASPFQAAASDPGTPEHYARMAGAIVTLQGMVQSLQALLAARLASPPSSLPVPSKVSIGDRVRTTASLNVRQTPAANGLLLGTQAVGVLGTVEGGPVNANGFNWWRVNYDSGADGSSVEDYLVKVQ